MSPLLHLRLFLLARRARPSPPFLSSLEARLFPRKQVFSTHHLRVLRFAAVPALLIVSLMAGTGSYAYSSDRVLPGDFLYSLRQNLEGFEIQLASVTGMKDRVRLRQLERRARERFLLQQRQKKAPAKPAPKPSAKPQVRKT